MTDEDLQEMARRLRQEHFLYRTGFKPIRSDARELWLRGHELYTRSRALVSALEELTAGEREGAR